VWTDTSTGLLWNCAEPGASEYDSSRDTTTIVYQGLTYYCRSAAGPGTTIATTATETSTTTMPDPLVLPDPTITPGVLNPNVRQATIGKTICKSGWTATIRPPVSYTNALKIQQMPLSSWLNNAPNTEADSSSPASLLGRRARRTRIDSPRSLNYRLTTGCVKLHESM
jgi:hypothetical protein